MHGVFASCTTGEDGCFVVDLEEEFESFVVAVRCNGYTRKFVKGVSLEELTVQLEKQSGKLVVFCSKSEEVIVCLKDGPLFYGTRWARSNADPDFLSLCILKETVVDGKAVFDDLIPGDYVVLLNGTFSNPTFSVDRGGEVHVVLSQKPDTDMSCVFRVKVRGCELSSEFSLSIPEARYVSSDAGENVYRMTSGQMKEVSCCVYEKDEEGTRLTSLESFEGPKMVAFSHLLPDVRLVFKTLQSYPESSEERQWLDRSDQMGKREEEVVLEVLDCNNNVSSQVRLIEVSHVLLLLLVTVFAVSLEERR